MGASDHQVGVAVGHGPGVPVDEEGRIRVEIHVVRAAVHTRQDQHAITGYRVDISEIATRCCSGEVDPGPFPSGKDRAKGLCAGRRALPLPTRYLADVLDRACLSRVFSEVAC